MTITLNQTSFTPRTKMTSQEAIARACKKAYGERGEFFQNHSLPTGYGSILKEKQSNCNVIDSNVFLEVI